MADGAGGAPEPDVFLVEDSETFADCTLRAGDYAVAAVAALDEGGPEPVVRAVYLSTSLAGEEGAVLLAPADARRLAAGLLNAADAVEGVTPLFLFADREALARAAAAAALRDAADALGTDAPATLSRGIACAASLLRARADAIEAGE